MERLTEPELHSPALRSAGPGKIRIFLPIVEGGVRTLCANLSAYLKAHGIAHELIRYGAADALGEQESTDDRIEFRSLYSRYATQSAVYRWLLRNVAPEDTLVCNDSLELNAIEDLKLGNKVIFVLNGDLDHYERIVAEKSGLIDAVFTVSTGLKEKYQKRYPQLDWQYAPPLVANVAALGKVNDTEPLKVAYIGRLEIEKGGDDFIAIVNGLTGKGFRFTAFLPKQGNEAALLQQLPEEIEVKYGTDNAALMELLPDFDVLLFPSRSEGFGLAVLEAMKRGVVPVVRNLEIGIPDMVTDGENGIVCSTPEAMTRALVKLGEDRRLLGRLKQAAHLSANRNFDPEANGARFVKLLATTQKKNKKFCARKAPMAERMLPDALYRLIKKVLKK